MKLSFSIIDHCALVPGLGSSEALAAWAASPSPVVDPSAPVEGPRRLPMMRARRMSRGIRHAVECSLELMERSGTPDAVVFSSRHGELARGEKLLKAIALGEPVSPTDFMMSVHNAAAGMLTIEKHLMVPASSVAAGADSFTAALTEAAAMLVAGRSRVLVVDFESALPDIVGSSFEAGVPSFDYAVGFVLAAPGEEGTVCTMDAAFDYTGRGEPGVPPAIAFLHALESGAGEALVTGAQCTSRFTFHGEDGR